MYERTLISESDRKANDERMNAAAESLCYSAGILAFISSSTIPKWEDQHDEKSLSDRPPELTSDVTLALSKVYLAEAESLAIRRLLSKNVGDMVALQLVGPPLAKGHPKPSLLFKLFLNVVSLYDAALGLVKSVGKVDKDITTYMTNERTWALGMSYKWLGIDAGESNEKNKTGEAIGWLEMAYQQIHPLKKKQERVAAELQVIDAFLKSYKRTNSSVRSYLT